VGPTMRNILCSPCIHHRLHGLHGHFAIVSCTRGVPMPTLGQAHGNSLNRLRSTSAARREWLRAQARKWLARTAAAILAGLVKLFATRTTTSGRAQTSL
jgi:hypothetical protein